MRRVIADELKDVGYEVIEAANGREGIEAIVARVPDLVLCDGNMPVMTGYEVHSVLRDQHPELAGIPFIFLSAKADRKDIVAGMQLGADDYVTKPVDIEMLLLTIAARLERSRRFGDRLEAERSKAQAQSRKAAVEDPLTGLGNARRIAEAVDTALAGHQAVTFLLVDIDRFKSVGLAFGRAQGDDVLRITGARLLREAGETACVARLTADRFAVMVPRTEDVVTLAEALRRACAEPCAAAGRGIFVTVSVGLVRSTETRAGATALLNAAETAVVHAKRAGGNAVVVFRPELATVEIARMDIEQALRGAHDAGEFELYYQPKIALQTRRPVGMEALLRWRSPTLGTVSPGDFIRVAEEGSFILDLGAFVIRDACRRMRGWLDCGLDPGMRRAVHVSAKQVRHPLFVETVGGILAETGLAPENVLLEITESGLVEDGGDILGCLTALRDIGLTLSTDDFGTGYSALSYLARLPLHEIKIDQSFVRGLPDVAGCRSIVRAVVSMARDLGMKTVAEGVETEEQIAFLVEQGCDVGQGYYFSRPLDAAGFASFVGLPAS